MPLYNTCLAISHHLWMALIWIWGFSFVKEREEAILRGKSSTIEDKETVYLKNAKNAPENCDPQILFSDREVDGQ